MTTIAESRLSGALQALVDARLDTIDRMLLGRVDRQDRLAIVRDVESQVFDLLRGRDAGSLDRDDVLAVLARLDPPEAYLPDDESSTIAERGPARLPSGPRAFRPSPEPGGQVALASGILGMVSVLMVFISTMIVFAGDFGPGALAYVVIFGSIGLTFIVGLLAVILAARARLRGGWAVVGLVHGITTLLATFGGATLLILN